MASSSATWDAVIPHLAEHAAVVAPDLPGHGGSTNPGGDYSLGAHASCIRDLMIALGIPRATMVGHSLGGGVAMQAAYQFPERCERLVLVDSGGLGREVALYLRALALPGSELVLSVGCSPRVVTAGRTVGQWLRRVGLRPTASIMEVARCYASLVRPEARLALLRTLRSVVDAGGQRVSAADRLPLAAHIPTLIVWGDRDGIIPPAHGRAAHAAIPGSRLEVFAETGHFPQAEQPERFALVLADFMRASAPASLSEDGIRSLLRE
jgi:pimeloyl-ACP methyl ester carboxylesterase